MDMQHTPRSASWRHIECTAFMHEKCTWKQFLSIPTVLAAAGEPICTGFTVCWQLPANRFTCFMDENVHGWFLLGASWSILGSPPGRPWLKKYIFKLLFN